MMRIDARLPLRFGPSETLRPDEALLTDASIAPATSPHGAACACCIPRSGAALALATLFRNRATGSGPPFRAVLASVGRANEDALKAALESDPVASGRFRLA